MGYSGVCFGGSGGVCTLLELLGEYGGAEIGSVSGISDVNRDRKLEGYPM